MTAAVVTPITSEQLQLAPSRIDCIRGELTGARLALQIAWLHVHGHDPKGEQLLRAVAGPLRAAAEHFQVTS